MLNPDFDTPAVDVCPDYGRPIPGIADTCPYCGCSSTGVRYRQRLRKKHGATILTGIFLIVLGCILTVADPTHTYFELPAKGVLIFVGLIAFVYSSISLALRLQ